MEDTMKKNVVTLIQILAISACTTIIIATPSRATAADQPAFSTVDVHRLHDSMKKMGDALTTSLAKKPQNPRTAFSRLVIDGFLAAYPPVPEGIGDGSGYFGKGDYDAWSDRNARIGGCGPNSIGEKRTYNILLRNVSDEFCKAYNKTQGLAEAILGNCQQNPDAACTASGSNDGNDPVDSGKTSFCIKTSAATNIIFYNTGLDAKVPCN